MDVLTDSCTDCDITSDIIDRLSFACYPESPTYVTYRARLEGTSETDSGSLISLIEDWVRGGVSIIVTGVLMTVDSDCSVAISSLNEGECFEVLPITDPTANSTTATTNASSSANTGIIIGGIMAVVVVVLIIAVTVVIIVALVSKNRRADLLINRAE